MLVAGDASEEVLGVLCLSHSELSLLLGLCRARLGLSRSLLEGLCCLLLRQHTSFLSLLQTQLPCSRTDQIGDLEVSVPLCQVGGGVAVTVPRVGRGT